MPPKHVRMLNYDTLNLSLRTIRLHELVSAPCFHDMKIFAPLMATKCDNNIQTNLVIRLMNITAPTLITLKKQ